MYGTEPQQFMSPFIFSGPVFFTTRPIIDENRNEKEFQQMYSILVPVTDRIIFRRKKFNRFLDSEFPNLFLSRFLFY